MKLSIGNKIRDLRRERGITQEQLADRIGVSFKAVSKWENGIALPDITLVPALAGYFQISIDELFTFRQEEIRQNIDEICREACKYRETDPIKSRKLLEEGLQKYPYHDTLLHHLLYVMNYTENPEETISVAGRLAERTDNPAIKYDALRFLAYACHAKGDDISALAAIEQLPEITFTKLTEMAFLLTGKTKREAAEKQKWISFENMLQMMVKTAECREEAGDIPAALSEMDRALQLLSVMEKEEKTADLTVYQDYLHRQMERLRSARSNTPPQATGHQP